MMRVLHLINTFTSGDERDKRAQEGELEPKFTSPITVQTPVRIPVLCSLIAPARGA